MAHPSSSHYTAKKTAVENAAEKINEALSTIASVFKCFQDNYLQLLLEHEELKERLKETSEAVKNSPKKRSPLPTHKNLPFSSENHVKVMLSLSNRKRGYCSPPKRNPTLSSQRQLQEDDLHDFTDDPETPGFVETTQFPVKERPSLLRLQRSAVKLKRNVFPNCSTSKNNENLSQGTSKPQQTIGLSKNDVTIRLTPSGKVDRQQRLVLRPMEQVLELNSREKRIEGDKNRAESQKNRADLDKKGSQHLEQKNTIVDSDETIFDKAFSMEDVIELTRDGNPRKKGRLRLVNRLQPKDTVSDDDLIFSDSEFEAMEPTLTQIEADVTLNGRNNQKLEKNMQNNRKNRDINKKRVNNANISEISDQNVQQTDQKTEKWQNFGIIHKSKDKVENTYKRKMVKSIDKIENKSDKPEKSKVNGNICQSKNKQKEIDMVYLREDSQSPDLAKGAYMVDLEDENDNDMDETYFPKQIGSLRVVEEADRREDSHGKRKPSAEPGACRVQEKEKQAVLDVDGDWDTDVSLEKWNSSPPQKKKFMDSYDIIPEKKKTSPKFVYKTGVVRNKQDRAKLQGWACRDCEKYYGNMNLTEEELRKRMNQCSRHRSKFNERRETPPGFWNPVFDETPFSQKTQG